MAIINIKNTAGDWEEMPALQGNPDDFINPVYPVGSIYMSVNDVSPSTLFGGSWEKIEDTFLLASGSTFALGQTGGEENHILTAGEMPAHNHDIYVDKNTGLTGQNNFYPVNFIQVASNYVDKNVCSTSGGNQPHNNMPPYLVVNIWKRIS